MAQRYRMVRLPEEVFQRYANVKIKMEKDISNYAGCNIKMSMPKVFDAFVNPNVNSRWIELDVARLSDFAQIKKRGRR